MPWIFLLLPWLELWTLIELGSRTSALTALAYVFLTLVVGISLVRAQGLALLRQAQQQSGGAFFGPQLLMDELALVSCGLLLAFPGLVTDGLALVFLIGPLRRRLFGSHRTESGPADGPEVEFSRSQNGEEHVTLEGEFRRLDD